ncbi:hypothetical protein M3182_08660 [Mesobacillus maritimus]|uniref:hypothetical protein n=1 Tax=Mesobacillus maritimus TaxID=1643336 RepID=UPI00203C918F|nr:hypothetical protein [Mesobacillus maritimus]MCM3585814.1 hypothetical protein [Mesobacillus maritimus]MCM3670574.1 hypothetical protein [Mesobacillus maritimus]
MKDRKSEAENANIKINQILNGENEQDTIDVDPLINNNNVALVLNDQENENK